MYTYWRCWLSSIWVAGAARPGLVTGLFDRGDLDEGVARLVPEGEQVEVADHRIAVAADVEHAGDLVIACLERPGLLEELTG